jgi:hypothetical protein
MSREYLSLQQRRLQKVDANRRVRDSAKLAQVICAEEGRSKRAANTRKTPNPARFEVFDNWNRKAPSKQAPTFPQIAEAVNGEIGVSLNGGALS